MESKSYREEVGYRAPEGSTEGCSQIRREAATYTEQSEYGPLQRRGDSRYTRLRLLNYFSQLRGVRDTLGGR